ncbi:hypothetical protein C8F04DRAFT_1070678 [Mycena alexandri]|uniref:SET domain-containing protein n=1 Tax=Mycena alexandri TaxID=1745969 RepID=A0AAD6TCT8_9AGAR|nr:hypothetical protein C8F04DRAFT_1070678 [Mycena alexandri]
MRPAKRQRRVPPEPAVGGPSSPRRFSPLRLLWLVVPAAVAGLAFFISTSTDPSIPEINGLQQAPPFVVRDIPGKGKGVVATRDIKQGELLIQEPPLFVVPKSISESPAALISRLLNNVTQANRDAFWSLSYVNFPEGLDPETHPEEVALAIFQTNAVSANNDGVGIFPRMARLNHGCASAFNVVYSWRKREQQIFIHALRDIQRGQELLTTYTETKRTRNERREFLSQQYGFMCTCAVCSLDDAASKLSDERLTAISHYYGHFATWGSESISGVEAISTINTIWKLEDEEGYWSERGQLAADAAWISAAHSDASAARFWAQLAVKWYSYELGADSELVSEVQRIAENPEQHPAWGSRKPLTVGPLV